jgi:hypothetical protein
VNYVEVLKIDAAVIFPKTGIVYYPICSNKSLYQETYLSLSLKVINAEEILEVKRVILTAIEYSMSFEVQQNEF